ncbi:10882_t:CDS:10 [Acaulospora morrowiae]|uniref:10882_t:CDS:1 n=1 Tax=Acaulospora morrowiae TaxID=94023 RepID=A0A9N8VB77_9GLOM|nr:10882_t:CDS:10 [Acaulospora morrowiae]
MFPLSQKRRAEEVCYEALKIIASSNGEQAEKARTFLETFNEQIDSRAVQGFWENVHLRNEKSKTRDAQLLLNEKKKQLSIQIKLNVIEEFRVMSDLCLSKFKKMLDVMNTSDGSRSKEKRALDSDERSNNNKKIKITNTDEIDSESNDPKERDKKSTDTKDKIQSNYEDKDEECSLDDGSNEEDKVELADISFNSFKLKNNEGVRGRLINMTKRAIKEMKQYKKVDSKIMSIIGLGLSSIIDLSSEFKQGMRSWFKDDWIPLKNKALSKINLTVEEFSGEILEFITKVENLSTLHDFLGARLLLEKVTERPTNIKFRQILKVYFYVLDLLLENPYLFVRKNGQPQKHTEIQHVIKMVDPILEIIFSDCQNLVRLTWGESILQVTNSSKRKPNLCVRTEDGTKELSHSECASKATMLEILNDRSKALRTNKCILDKYLKNDLPGEALENTTIFGFQLAGLYFGFDGPVFEFPAQICSIDVLRRTLEVLYYFKEQVIRKAKYLSQNSRRNAFFQTSKFRRYENESLQS